MKKVLLAIMFLAPAPGRATPSPDEARHSGASAPLGRAASVELEGFVVRTGGGKVFLDLGRSSGISVGDAFVVIKEGEELKHPVSGASLGPVIETVGSGTVGEIQDKYSIGTLAAEEPGLAGRSPAVPGFMGATGAPGLVPGLKVRVTRGASPAVPAPAPHPGPGVEAPRGRAPSSRGPVIPIEAVDLAAADVNGDGETEVVLADKKSVRAYPYRLGAAEWTPACSFDSEATGARFLSVEAADLDGDGRAEIFATLYNKLLKQVETLVLDCAGPKMSQRDSIPWMVRSYQTPEGRRALALQQLTADSAFPASRVYALEFSDGKYKRSRRSIKQRRLEWAYGFGLAEVAGGRVLVGYNHADRLQIRFKKGNWASKDAFGQTAERLLWRGKTLNFHPNVILETAPGRFDGLYTLKNIPRFLGLASAFGLFDRSELHHLRWNGLGLEEDWTSELGGYAAGLAEIRDSGGSLSGLLVAVVGANGSTSVWTYEK